MATLLTWERMRAECHSAIVALRENSGISTCSNFQGKRKLSGLKNQIVRDIRDKISVRSGRDKRLLVRKHQGLPEKSGIRCLSTQPQLVYILSRKRSLMR